MIELHFPGENDAGQLLVWEACGKLSFGHNFSRYNSITSLRSVVSILTDEFTTTANLPDAVSRQSYQMVLHDGDSQHDDPNR